MLRLTTVSNAYIETLMGCRLTPDRLAMTSVTPPARVALQAARDSWYEQLLGIESSKFMFWSDSWQVLKTALSVGAWENITTDDVPSTNGCKDVRSTFHHDVLDNFFCIN